MIASIIVMVFVLSGIDEVRARSTNAGPGGFNSVLQLDQALDDYSRSLEQYRFSLGDAELMQSASEQYQKEFNIVWGNLQYFTVQFNQDSRPQEVFSNFKHDAKQFLNKTDSLMAPNRILSADEVSNVITELQFLQDDVHLLGREYFFNSLSFRDSWVSNINNLHKALYIFSAALIGTAGLLVALLWRSNQKKIALIEEANIARKKQNDAIAELRSGKLEQRAKDSFIAAASHDLSQPLHALGLFLGSLKNHVHDAQGRETLRDAIQCSTNLGYLFKSVLDMSRLDAGVVEVNKKHFYLAELISMLEQEYRTKAHNAGVDIDVQLTNAVIYTDPLLLSRIIRNLIENALVHSEATLITIGCTQIRDHQQLTITDNGKGISENNQKRIFDEYYQLGSRTNTKGLGLGLSIVRRLAELLDIKLSLKSNIQSSTQFSLELEPGQAEQIDRMLTSDTIKNDSPPDSGAIVAVVDDDQDICTAMSAMLSSAGIEAITATTTDKLIDELIESSKLPDLIVADYRLSKGQTGDQAIVQLKRALNIEVPALLVTGDTSPLSVANAASSGFEFLHKPIQPDVLSTKIQQLLVTSHADAAPD